MVEIQEEYKQPLTDLITEAKRDWNVTDDTIMTMLNNASRIVDHVCYIQGIKDKDYKTIGRIMPVVYETYFNMILDSFLELDMKAEEKGKKVKNFYVAELEDYEIDCFMKEVYPDFLGPEELFKYYIDKIDNVKLLTGGTYGINDSLRDCRP